MSMSSKYPFSMDWTGYSGTELIKEARSNLDGCDRADVLELARELARRYEIVSIEFDKRYMNEKART